jgi:hypothetical protein
MKLLHIVVISLIAMLLSACDKAPPTNRKAGLQGTAAKDKAEMTPVSVGAIQVTLMDSFPEDYRVAVGSVAQELRNDREDPAEYYAEIEPTSRALMFHLWHQDAFKEENRGLLGNPGGKCRDFLYDLELHRVTEKLFWQ